MISILAIPKPLPDELLLSWALRTADANGLSMPVFSGAYLGGGGGRHGILPSDVRRGFPELLYSLGLEEKMSDVYMGLSTFCFESAVMTPGRQARYAANVFYPADGLNPPVDTLFNAVKICPDCVREDKEAFGIPYLHCAHQLSGVQVCWRHGIFLRTFKGIRGHECDFNEDDYVQEPTELSEADMRAYADYAHALFAAGVRSNSYMVKDAVFSRMAELGYGVSDGYESFLDDFEVWEHSGLWNGGDIVRFLKVKLILAQHLPMEETLPIVMFLFPDPEDFIHALGDPEPVLKQYTCPVCGELYCRTGYVDFGCPACNKGLSGDERFRRMVDEISGKEYEPLEPFESLDSKLRFLHKSCGKEISIKPRNLIFEGVRCICESTVTEAEAREAVEAHEGFELVRFTGTNDPVVIRHNACGREFECNYHKFLNFPGCRACAPPHMTTELYSERVKSLTDGEYTVVGEFVDQHTKIEIRHEKCGRVGSYQPNHFLEGQRCRACSKMTAAWESSFHALEQYKAEYGNTNVPKRFTDNSGYNLGRWCQGMRDRYKKGILTAEKIRRLEEIGFAWDPLEAEWQENCKRYRQYVAENGLSIARRADYLGVHLGAWIYTQKKRNSEGKLSDERKRKLLLINPDLFNERS